MNATMGMIQSIFICVVLPVSIVLIVYLASINNDNKRAKVLIKAIEANNNIDADKLARAMQKSRKTPREIFNRRLTRGCSAALIGLVLLTIGIVNWIVTGTTDSDATSVPAIFGGIMLAIGASNLIVCYINRHQFGNNHCNEE